MFKKTSISGLRLAIFGRGSGVAGKLPDDGIKGVNVLMCGSTFSVERDNSYSYFHVSVVPIKLGLNLT